MDSMMKICDMELEEQGWSDWQNGLVQKRKRYLKEHFCWIFQNMM